MTHTKLPWHFVNTRRRRTLEILPEPDTLTSCGIANVWSTNDEEDDPEMIANARFIVTACNSHDDLLAACKAALEELLWIKREYEDRDDIEGPDEAMMFKLDAAITQAKDGAQ